MANLKELKTQIEKANALGVANLTDKGVDVSAAATTYDIMSAIAEISGGGTEYTNIVNNPDKSFTLIDKDGTEHTIACEYTDGKLTSATYDGKPVDLTYEDDTLVSVGETEIDVSNSGVISTNKLEKTNTDVFLTIDSLSYSKANNEVSILGMYYVDGYTNPLVVSRTQDGARIKRNGTAADGSILTTTVEGELWYYYCNYGHNKAGTLTQDYTIDVNQYVNDVSTEEAAQTLIKIYLGCFKEDNKDFQNGLIVGMVSGGVVEVEITTKEEHEKTVTITENGTTEILPDENKTLSKVTVVTDIASSLLDHTVTFKVDGEAVEIVSVKSGNSVNIPVSKGASYEWFLNEQKVNFPYTPTENTTFEGRFIVNLVPADLNAWYKNDVQQKNFQLVLYDDNTTENIVTYKGTNGYEYAYYPVSLEEGKKYEFSLAYKIKDLTYSAYSTPNVPFISFAKEITTTSSQTQWYKALAGVEINNTSGADYVKYSVVYQATESFDGYVVFDTACIRDGLSGTLFVKNILVCEVGDYDG